MRREAIILAGGFGTRLQSLVNNVPKPMASINGKPFLSYILAYLKYFKYEKIIFSTGHLAHKISSFYGSNYENIKLEYCEEKTPLGTGGGVKASLNFTTTQNILVVNGDSFFDIDLNDFELFHKKNNSNFSIALRKVDNADRYGTIEMNKELISQFKEKDSLNAPGIINAGTYLVNRDFFLENCNKTNNFSLEKDFLENHVEKFPFYGYLAKGYFIDIGIPEDFNRAQNEFKRFKY